MAFFVAAVVILLCGLISNIRLKYSLTFERERILLFINARFFYGLIPFRAQACLSFFPIKLYVGKKEKRVNIKRDVDIIVKNKSWPLIKALFKQWKRWLRVDELRIRGAVGNAEDACAAILWTGAISILLDCSARALLSPNYLNIRIMPAWGSRCFCLNMEGIVTLKLWQVIGVAIRHQISGTRGKHIWRILSKT